MHNEHIELPLKIIIFVLAIGVIGLAAIEAFSSIFNTPPSRLALFSEMIFKSIVIGTIFFAAWFIYLQYRGFSPLSIMLLAGAVIWANYWMTGVFDSIAMSGRPSFIVGRDLAPWEVTWYTSLWFKSLPVIAMSTAGGILAWRERHFSF